MSWDKRDIQSLGDRFNVIPAGDERILRYCEDTMMRGSPDDVMVARDEQEVVAALEFCNAKGVPVTFCGSQTSMTGASVPLEGLLISTEKLEGVSDIISSGGETVASVRPGTVVADLQKTVQEEGLFYPVAPTSRDECRIGANVNTNATGEDSYKYGPIRNSVRELEIVLPNGSKRVLKRKPDERPSWERNRAGYFTGWKNPLDLIIGSEGTLAFVSKVYLQLLPSIPAFFSALVPCPDNLIALHFVTAIATGMTELKPRALELIDSGALAHMRTAKGFPKIPENVKALLYIKQEYGGDVERDALMIKWFEVSSEYAGEPFANHILMALTTAQQEDFRLWRHHVPESANELGRSFWSSGGGKVGSDWWVPIERLMEMMAFFYNVADGTGLPYMGYAHIGSGHPHTNILAKDAVEKAKAEGALITCCRKAVELGGGVAGEHGIGKLHTNLVSIQHGGAVIDKMKSWKREYDPNWLLGRGNIFDIQPVLD